MSKFPLFISPLVHLKTAIDVVQLSKLTDPAYLGPKTALEYFGPLLKRKAENPDATIIAFFLDAVREIRFSKDYRSSKSFEIERLRPYMRVAVDLAQQGNPYSAERERVLSARSLFWDVDEIFNRLKSEYRLDEISKPYGLKIKSKNTIIQPLPLRPKRDAKQEEFDILFASDHLGYERYVEWESVA